MSFLFKSIFLFFMLSGALAYGAAPAKTVLPLNIHAEKAAEVKVAESDLVLVAELKAEIKVLKAQNELIRDYQGSMSDTVYWALGIISGVFAILISYSVFTNFRFYEQDKARLKSDLDSVISNFKSELLVKFEQDKSELERSYETRNESNMRIVLEQGVEVRARVDAVRTELQAKLDELSNKIKTHEAALLASSKRVHQVEYELRAVEEHVWEIKDVPDCVLLTQCQGIRASKDADFTYATNSVLKRMNETLKKHYVEKNRRLTPEMHKRLEEALVAVDGMDPQTIQEVRVKMDMAFGAPEKSLFAAADLGELP